MLLTLFVLSLLGGLLSGMLGVGGGVVMIPLMLVVPTLIGVGRLDMLHVAGISMLQVLASSVSGLIIHRGNGMVNGPALRWIGFPLAFAALTGAAATKYVDEQAVLAVFTVLVFVSFLLLLGAKQSAVADSPQGGEELRIDRPLAMLIGVGVGIASGMVGAGGGFILVPLMLVVLKLPLKVTVGTSLGIVFLGAVAGSVGKISSGQVPWNYLLPVILGSIPMARLGARLSHRLSSRVLRSMLLVLVFLSFLQSLWKLVG